MPGGGGWAPSLSAFSPRPWRARWGVRSDFWLPGLCSLVPGPSGSQGWVLRTPPKNELSLLIAAEDGESPYPGAGAPTPPLFLNNGLLRGHLAQAGPGHRKGPRGSTWRVQPEPQALGGGYRGKLYGWGFGVDFKGRGPASLRFGYKEWPRVSVGTRPCA